VTVMPYQGNGGVMAVICPPGSYSKYYSKCTLHDKIVIIY